MVPTSPNLLILDDASPLAQGRNRLVYQHPHDPATLIKVFRPDRLDSEGRCVRSKTTLFKRRRSAFDIVAREVEELLLWMRQFHLQVHEWPPFAISRGFVATSLGWGLAVEKIVNANGHLGLTLGEISRRRLVTDEHEAALNAFFERCERSHVVLCSTHLENLVFTTVRSGGPEVVCVDGLGENVSIPTHQWSRRLNAIRLRRLAEKARRALRAPELTRGNTILESAT